MLSGLAMVLGELQSAGLALSGSQLATDSAPLLSTKPR